MNYEGDERRVTPCKTHETLIRKLEHEVIGNGKPGLSSRMIRVEQAIYGDPINHQRGMLDKQDEILKFVHSVRPYLNPKLLLGVMVLSVAACLKVLGLDLVGSFFKHFI